MSLGRIATAGRDKLTKVWNQQGQQQKAFPAFADIATDVSFCDETNRVAAAGFGGQLKLFNYEDAAVASDLNTKLPALEQQVIFAQQTVQSTEKLLAAAVQKQKAARDVFQASEAKLNEMKVARQQTDTRWFESIRSKPTSVCLN